MNALAKLWRENKYFKWGSVVVLVIIVLGIFSYFGAGPPA